MCDHNKFSANVKVNKLKQVVGGEVVGITMEVSIHCTDCGEQFQFVGVEQGYSNINPVVNITNTILTVPIIPKQ